MKHSLVLTSLLTLFLFNSNVFAEVEGVSTGAQLQAVAEKNTTFIETKELKIMLDEELN